MTYAPYRSCVWLIFSQQAAKVSLIHYKHIPCDTTSTGMNHIFRSGDLNRALLDKVDRPFKAPFCFFPGGQSNSLLINQQLTLLDNSAWQYKICINTGLDVFIDIIGIYKESELPSTSWSENKLWQHILVATAHMAAAHMADGLSGKMV